MVKRIRKFLKELVSERLYNRTVFLGVLILYILSISIFVPMMEDIDRFMKVAFLPASALTVVILSIVFVFISSTVHVLQIRAKYSKCSNLYIFLMIVIIIVGGAWMYFLRSFTAFNLLIMVFFLSIQDLSYRHFRKKYKE